jgi:hypothetical protein
MFTPRGYKWEKFVREGAPKKQDCKFQTATFRQEVNSFCEETAFFNSIEIQPKEIMKCWIAKDCCVWGMDTVREPREKGKSAVVGRYRKTDKDIIDWED